MRVLVTGGAGFIGSRLSHRLLAIGHEVTVVDDLSTGHRGNVPAGAELYVLDLARAESLASLEGRHFDAVCHLAGQSSGEKSFRNPVNDFDANARSTLVLASWSLRHEIPTFLHASSMGVYGTSPSLPVREDDALRPISFYGASKRAAEEALRLMEGRLRTVSFRMFSVYGPGQDLSELKQGMVSIYLAYLLRGDPVLVKGSLERVRDFVYIDDVVAAWEAGLDGAASGPFNVGTGTGTRVRTLLVKLLAACGRKADYPIEVTEGTPGDQQALYADVTRVRRDFGWEPRVGLDDGLAATAAWADAAAPPT